MAEAESQCLFMQLPPEVVVIVVSYCQPRALLALLQTCYTFRDQSELWKYLVIKSFPEVNLDSDNDEAAEHHHKFRRLWHLRAQLLSHWQQGHYQKFTLAGHLGGVACMSFQKDLIVSGSADKCVIVWHAPTGKLVKRLVGHTAGVTCVKVSLRWNTVVSGSMDCTLRVWDLAEGTSRFEMKGHSRHVLCLSYDEEKNHAISGSGDHTICIWDIAQGTLLKQLRGHRSNIISLAFNGNFIASGAKDFTLKVWNRASGDCIETINHREDVFSVVMNERMAFGGSLDCNISTYEFDSKVARSIIAHKGDVFVIELQDKMLVSAGRDRKIKFWKTDKGILDCEKVFEGHQGPIEWIAFGGPASRFLVSSAEDGTIRVWDTTTKDGEKSYSVKNCNWIFCLGADEQKVVYGSASSGELCVMYFDEETKQEEIDEEEESEETEEEEQPSPHTSAATPTKRSRRLNSRCSVS